MRCKPWRRLPWLASMMAALAANASADGVPTSQHAESVKFSNSAVPEVVVALDVHGQERIVIRPGFVLWQLDLLLRVGVGLASAYSLLHCRGKILQVGELLARVVFGPGLLAARSRMAGNKCFPIHLDDLLQPFLDLGHISVGHAAELYTLDRNPIDSEDDLLPRQAHHQRAVGVVLADIVELEHCTAERDVASAVDDLVGDDDVIGLERGDTVFRIPVRDEGRAEVLERLATGDVVEMAVAVDDIFDWRLCHGFDRVDIGLHRPALADRIGGDHAVGRDNEHRLMTAISEDVDVVRDLGSGEWRRSWLLRLYGSGKHDGDKRSGHTRKVSPQHVRFLLSALKRAEPNSHARALQMQ